MNQITPTQWGARIDYDQWSDQQVPKDGIVVHYAGPETAARGAFDGVAREKRLLQTYERYHIDTRGWRGIAYGWAIGMTGSIYRLRGWNLYGAHAGDVDTDGIPDNHEKIPVLFIIGGDIDPSDEAIRSFQQLRAWLESHEQRSLYLWGHKEISSTSCPGQPLFEYVQSHRIADQPAETPIRGPSTVTAGQAIAWARNHQAHQRLIDVIPIYLTVAAETGVRAEVGLAQAAKETAWGKFTGIVQPGQHNWCGLKTATAAGDTQSDHATFPDDRTGIAAHLQHLSLYAGREFTSPVDPRHFPWIKGTATSVEQLGGRWAPNPDYGRSIVDSYLTPLVDTPVPPVDDTIKQVLLTQIERLKQTVENI